MAFPVVLFDFGGVVIKTPFELVPAFERRFGLPRGSVAMRGPFDPAADPVWERLVQRDISEREYWHAQAARLAGVVGETNDPLRTVMDAIFDLPEVDIVRSEILDLIEEAASRRLRVALLTNDLARFHDPAWLERMTILQSFDPLVDLSYAGVLKPDLEAYAIALDALGCPAGEVLFVDDQPANVAGAGRAGIDSVRFDVTEPVASVAKIRARLDG